MTRPQTLSGDLAAFPWSIPDRQSTYLFLVRHGATEANLHEPPWLQGRGMDLPLCPLGRQHARLIADLLRRLPISRLVSSPLLRARQTAEMIARDRHVVEIVPSLAECDVGRWEGLDWATIATHDQDAYRRFRDNPAEHGYPEGETFQQLQRRVAPAIDALLEEAAGQVVAAVSHKVANRVYLASVLGLPLAQALRVQQDNGCVNLLRRCDGRTELLSLNSVFHLLG